MSYAALKCLQPSYSTGWKCIPSLSLAFGGEGAGSVGFTGDCRGEVKKKKKTFILFLLPTTSSSFYKMFLMAANNKLNAGFKKYRR